MIKGPLFFLFRLLILFVSSAELENRILAEITCCVTLCMSPPASPTSWTLITPATARQSGVGDGYNCGWLWTYGQQEDRMEQLLLCYLCWHSWRQQLHKTRSEKKKMLLGNNVVYDKDIGGSKTNSNGIDQLFFFAVHRLYYVHQWKPLLYLLNSHIKHSYFYLKASPALFPLTPRMTLMWWKSSCRHATWIEGRLRDMVL